MPSPVSRSGLAEAYSDLQLELFSVRVGSGGEVQRPRTALGLGPQEGAGEARLREEERGEGSSPSQPSGQAQAELLCDTESSLAVEGRGCVWGSTGKEG